MPRTYRPHEFLRKFNERYVKGPGCWLWIAGKSKAGYGQMSSGGKVEYAHRLSYIMNVGDIPPGMTIDHLCRTPACINPAHLEVVTMRENILRSRSATANNARKDQCQQGHAYNFITKAKGRRCTKCDNKKRNVRVKAKAASLRGGEGR